MIDEVNPLANYGVEDGTTLHLILRLRRVSFALESHESQWAKTRHIWCVGEDFKEYWKAFPLEDVTVTKFAGNKDTYGFLSNMYNMTKVICMLPVWLGPTINSRIVVKCSEQSIQLMKACWAQDLTNFKHSVQVNNGYEARKLGQQIQNLDK